MATVQDTFISPALRKLGVLAAGETPSYDDSEDARLALNQLLDQFSTESLDIPIIVRTTWAIVNGTQNYTVGTGGTVNVVRPTIIQSVQFQDTSVSPTLEYPLDMLTEDGWAGIAQKTLTSPFPSSWYYTPTYSASLGTLSLWPVPTSTTLQGVLYAKQAIAEFAALTTTVLIPPAYRRMLTMALALEIAPDYGVSPNPALVDAARDSMAAVKRINFRMTDMRIDQGALIQGISGRYMYDINTGE